MFFIYAMGCIDLELPSRALLYFFSMCCAYRLNTCISWNFIMYFWEGCSKYSFLEFFRASFLGMLASMALGSCSILSFDASIQSFYSPHSSSVSLAAIHGYVYSKHDYSISLIALQFFFQNHRICCFEGHKNFSYCS